MVESLIPLLPHYSAIDRLAQDAQKALTVFPTLRPNVLPLNDGTLTFCLEGTLPITYQNSVYNIPLRIVLAQQYPSECPTVTIQPIENMHIHPNHKYVGRDGKVFHPYLNQWGEQSRLNELIMELSIVFSDDPPVYSTARVLGDHRQNNHPTAPFLQPKPAPKPTPKPTTPPGGLVIHRIRFSGGG